MAELDDVFKDASVPVKTAWNAFTESCKSVTLHSAIVIEAKQKEKEAEKLKVAAIAKAIYCEKMADVSKQNLVLAVAADVDKKYDKIFQKGLDATTSQMILDVKHKNVYNGQTKHTTKRPRKN